MIRSQLFLATFLCAATFAATAPGYAQGGYAPEGQTSDVARLSVLEGDVWITDGGTGEWSAGTVNSPLVAGDEISTGRGARAEVQLDSHNVVRFDADSQGRIGVFARDRIRIEASRGRIAYSVFGPPPVTVEIATPDTTFRPTEGGLYTIDTGDGNATRVTVRKGRGVVSTPNGETEISQGQVATVSGTDANDIRVDPAPKFDPWENWADQRDHEILNARSWRSLNRNYSGAQDLDRYGEWRQVPDYGRVWVPQASDPDWAPYRAGYWVWKPYWGWTWVSYEPWGWAPYHYGRWVFIDGYWAWWPGPVTVSYVPVWAPAYVTFFGFGTVHSWGHVGWLPLGPADWYYPWWGRHIGPRPVVVQNIHVTNVVNVTNINATHVGRVAGATAIRPLAPPHRGQFSSIKSATEDARVRNAVSQMPSDAFGERHVRAAAAPIDAANFRRGDLIAGGAPAVPRHEVSLPVNRPDALKTAPDFGAGRRPVMRDASTPKSPSAVEPPRRDQSGQPQPDQRTRLDATRPPVGGPPSAARPDVRLVPTPPASREVPKQHIPLGPRVSSPEPAPAPHVTAPPAPAPAPAPRVATRPAPPPTPQHFERPESPASAQTAPAPHVVQPQHVQRNEAPPHAQPQTRQAPGQQHAPQQRPQQQQQQPCGQQKAC